MLCYLFTNLQELRFGGIKVILPLRHLQFDGFNNATETAHQDVIAISDGRWMDVVISHSSP